MNKRLRLVRLELPELKTQALREGNNNKARQEAKRRNMARGAWQLQNPDGTPLGVGLFASPLLARHYGRSRGYQIEEVKS
ncbi:MAG: hypothetical protein J2P41_22720 [Blastocatellia bacterium]|nr:hypothetical protein [Blastocatellia bacterium]